MALSLEEGLLGAGQIEGDAAGVAKVGPGPRLEVRHHGSAIAAGVELARQQEAQLGQLHRLAGVAEPRLEARADQQLADRQGLETAALADQEPPLRRRVAEQL